MLVDQPYLWHLLPLHISQLRCLSTISTYCPSFNSFLSEGSSTLQHFNFRPFEQSACRLIVICVGLQSAILAHCPTFLFLCIVFPFSISSKLLGCKHPCKHTASVHAPSDCLPTIDWSCRNGCNGSIVNFTFCNSTLILFTIVDSFWGQIERFYQL